MRRIVFLLAAAVVMTVADTEAKEKKDPVVMTIAGKEILLSEFGFFAKKDNSVDLLDKKSVEMYVELFKNYKLKVADAEALSIPQAPKFEQELNRYKKDLQESYLKDKAAEDAAMHRVYDRMNIIPGFKHLMFFLPGDELVTKDTVDLYNKALEAYNRIIGGESIDSVGMQVTDYGKSDKGLYETVDCIFPLQMPKVIESTVYAMKPGELSKPIRSNLGFHIIQIEKMTPNPGRVRIAQILTAYPSEKPTEEEKAETLKKSEEIYKKAIAGEDFSVLAETYSSDTVTGKKGGLLPYFGLCEMVKPFEETAFAFKEKDEISKPVATRYGYHILKLIEKKAVVPFEDIESQLY
ncbi:MAG: peptidylprolyl isomerase, partial [Tannerella sp.]|nr:peptidylprolyl isomerase [Tannerella sp.]